MLVITIAFAVICEIYVTSTINQASQYLVKATESRRAGDYEASKEYADLAWGKWREITNKSGYILADLTITSDVSVTLSRIGMLSQTDDNERFLEECTAGIIVLEHFLADNKNFLDGTLDN